MDDEPASQHGTARPPARSPLGAPVAGRPPSGVFGRLPSHAEIVRRGLPRSFTDPWEAWLRLCMAAARRRLGEDWIACWMEGPVWRFGLPAGLCGTQPVLGVWAPSVDRVGRDFPLTLATLDGPASLDTAGRWLDQAEVAVCEAVIGARQPSDVLDELGDDTVPLAGGFDDAWPAGGVPGGAAWPGATILGGAIWWTRGGSLVPPMRLTTSHLPTPATFLTMVVGAEPM